MLGRWSHSNQGTGLPAPIDEGLSSATTWVVPARRFVVTEKALQSAQDRTSAAVALGVGDRRVGAVTDLIDAGPRFFIELRAPGLQLSRTALSPATADGRLPAPANDRSRAVHPNQAAGKKTGCLQTTQGDRGTGNTEALAPLPEGTTMAWHARCRSESPCKRCAVLAPSGSPVDPTWPDEAALAACLAWLQRVPS